MTKTRQILSAMGSGSGTSREIARQTGLPRANVSVALCRLADLGLVLRAGVDNAGRPGRPFVRWRLAAVRAARLGRG